MSEKLYGTSDLGLLFGMKRQIVNYFIKEGRFPNLTKVGRSYAVTPGDALDFARAELKKRIDARGDLDAEIIKFEDAIDKLEDVVKK